jgi:hypothetical protein
MRNEEITISASRGALRVLRGLVDTDAGSKVSNYVRMALAVAALGELDHLELVSDDSTTSRWPRAARRWYRVKRMTSARKMLICAAIARRLGVPCGAAITMGGERQSG